MTGAFIRKWRLKEWRLKEMAKSEYFYSRFDEKWKVMGKHDKTKVNEQRVVSWRDFSKACLLRLLSTPPPIFKDKNGSFLWLQRGHLTWGYYDLLQGRRDSSESLTKCFSDSFNVQYAQAPYFVRDVFWTPIDTSNSKESILSLSVL